MKQEIAEKVPGYIKNLLLPELKDLKAGQADLNTKMDAIRIEFQGLSYKVDGIDAKLDGLNHKDEAIKIYAETTRMLVEELRDQRKSK